MVNLRGRGAVLGVLLVLALVGGCGDDGEKAGGGDLTATRCPLVADGDRYVPADDSFDTAELVGEPLERARSTASDHGCEVVVAMRDGEGLPVPTDVDPSRIYVYTDDGVVTEIEGVGGGI